MPPLGRASSLGRPPPPSLLYIRGQGAPHTAMERSRGSIVCVEVPPTPVYKGARGERCGQPWGAPGGVLLPPGVGLPPFPSWNRIREVGKERERRRGGAGPLSPCPIRTREGRGTRPPLASFLFSLRAHVGPTTLGGFPVTPRYSGKIPISPGTIPISKYRLPIYRSLCLNHFETPRHVHDHIRDSEQPSVHQNT